MKEYLATLRTERLPHLPHILTMCLEEKEGDVRSIKARTAPGGGMVS